MAPMKEAGTRAVNLPCVQTTPDPSEVPPVTKKRVRYEPTRPVFPTPAGLITSVDSEGKPNIITLGEVFNLSIRDPVIIGLAIAPARYSHTLICEQGEFVANLPPADLLEQVLECGQTSGRQTEKFEEFDLTPLPASEVEPPLIAECPVNIECRLLDVQTVGDHDLFQGEVVAHHVSPELIGEDGRIEPERLSAVAFAQWAFFDMGPLMGVWKR